jgi:two-component system sensor histidine kinase RegB
MNANLPGMHGCIAGAGQQPGATDTRAGLRNMQQLIQLRWIAVVGQLAAILFVHHVLGISLPLAPMLLALAALAAFNLASLLWLRRDPVVGDGALLLALLVDVATLTAQLHFSGGIGNPFVFLYVLQVTLGTMLLRPAASWLLAAAATLCVALLVVLPGPVRIPVDLSRGIADHYVQGLLICFVLVCALLVVFISRIARILRERDARVAELRQRAIEEEHVVRMGLLASGAAHELGTPLATLSVILGDWRRLPAFSSDPELLGDIEEMQAQVQRCKSIVTRILLAAGETRGDAPVETTLHAFLDAVVGDWRTSRACDVLEYRNLCREDPRIVADTGLRQMVFNVLDNALEASPGHVGLVARCEAGDLVVEVRDAGPGFEPEVLKRLGTPYNSSKGRPGGGLGLFLSANVTRTLGGRLSARNLPQGGAEVTIRLPLSALAIGGQDDAG